MEPSLTPATVLAQSALAQSAAASSYVVKLDVSAVKQREAARVERALNRLFATGRDDVGLDELCIMVDMPMGAIEAALVAMEAANKIMHRESRIHLI